MAKYIGIRLVQMVFTLFVFITLVYFLLEAQPGDISHQFIGNPRIPLEARQAIKKQLGLDQPVYIRYIRYLGNFVRGDFGVSYGYYPRSVIDIIKERAPRTLVLFLTATVVAFTAGFTLGKILAWRRGGFTEYAATIGGVALYTVFTPWFGLMMIWIFAFALNWLPVGKFLDPVLWTNAPVSADIVFFRMLITAAVALTILFMAMLLTRRIILLWRTQVRLVAAAVIIAGALIYWAQTPLGRYASDIAKHLILPVMTLSLISFAGTMLLTRSSMLETVREDFVMAAKAKGLPDKVVRDRHAARNALLPVVTSFVFSLAFALDGGVITETIFSWPGMGLTLLGAATSEDIPMAIGCLFFTGCLALTAHLVADILYAYLDPRIRYT